MEEMKKREAVIEGKAMEESFIPNCIMVVMPFAGIALFLSHLAKSGMRCSAFENFTRLCNCQKKAYSGPDY